MQKRGKKVHIEPNPQEGEENTYVDIKIRKIHRTRKDLDWKVVGTFSKSPNEYIFTQLSSMAGWKSYYKAGKTFRYKCCQEKNGCKSELKIVLEKDDMEDHLNFEIKVEISGAKSNSQSYILYQD